METVNITTIKNNLTDRTVTMHTDSGEAMVLLPGEMLTNTSRITLPWVHNGGEISPETIRQFSVTGFSNGFAYAAISGKGLTSALGTGTENFYPDDPHLVHITMESLEAGQNLMLTFEVNEIADGTLVTWVLGTLDEG